MNGLYGLFRESCIKYSDNIFVQYSGISWSYRQTDEMIYKISDILLKYGIVKGDRIIIFCDNSIEYIAAYFSVLRIGAVAVPLNPQKPTDSIRYIVDKCSPRLILTNFYSRGKLDKLVPLLSIDLFDISSLSDYIFFNNPDNPQAENEVEDEDNNALIIFTSGTTAFPKGVTLSHKNLLENTKAILDYLKLTPDDSILMTLPFTYSYGNSILLTHIAAGATIYLENSSAFPLKIIENIKKHKVTGFSTVGSYLNLFLKVLKNSDTGADILNSLRYITLAGEATSNDDIRFICSVCPWIKVFVMYGQTEAGARLSYLDPTFLDEKTGSVGKGLCNTELRVVNEFGEDVKFGEIGEIIARGPSIMKYYWGEPEATANVLKNGWLFTGDSAEIDQDGFIYIKGRKNDMIKHMGHRISPAEIENVLNSFENIRESAVVERTNGSINAIKAYVVLEWECNMDDIRKYVSSKLPYFMCPQIYEIVEQLPKTDTGKIKRSALRGN